MAILWRPMFSHPSRVVLDVMLPYTQYKVFQYTWTPRLRSTAPHGGMKTRRYANQFIKDLTLEYNKIPRPVLRPIIESRQHKWPRLLIRFRIKEYCQVSSVVDVEFPQTVHLTGLHRFEIEYKSTETRHTHLEVQRSWRPMVRTIAMSRTRA